MLGNKLRFGAFIAPFHPLDENPTLAINATSNWSS